MWTGPKTMSGGHDGKKDVAGNLLVSLSGSFRLPVFLARPCIGVQLYSRDAVPQYNFQTLQDIAKISGERQHRRPVANVG